MVLKNATLLRRLAYFELSILLSVFLTGDAASFDREWKQRTRQTAHGIKDRHRSNVRALAGAGTDHCQLCFVVVVALFSLKPM